jgi:hypothetical protein
VESGKWGVESGEWGVGSGVYSRNIFKKKRLSEFRKAAFYICFHFF